MLGREDIVILYIVADEFEYMTSRFVGASL